jgi:hypothetical protein
LINRNNFSTNKLSIPAVGLLLFLAVSPILFLGHASAAAPFTKAFIRLDNEDATVNTGGRVCFQPSSNPANTINVVVTFPTTSGTDYVVNATAANWTLNTTGLDTGQTALPALPATVSSVAGKAITITLTSSQALATTNLYCFNWAGSPTLTTSSAGASETTQGTIATNQAGPTLINQTTYSLSIITNDQVVVSGIVPPSFQFVLSGNTDSFTANLTPATVVSTTGRTITLTTNAASGWIVWAEDANGSSGKGALHSATASHYIAGVNGNAPGVASAALNTSQENYGLGVTINTNASGTVALNAAYDGTGSKAGTLSPSSGSPAFYPIADATSPANGDIINVNERANSIATTPEASDYTDTITFVGAGEF